MIVLWRVKRHVKLNSLRCTTRLKEMLLFLFQFFINFTLFFPLTSNLHITFKSFGHFGLILFIIIFIIIHCSPSAFNSPGIRISAVAIWTDWFIHFSVTIAQSTCLKPELVHLIIICMGFVHHGWTRTHTPMLLISSDNHLFDTCTRKHLIIITMCWFIPDNKTITVIGSILLHLLSGHLLSTCVSAVCSFVFWYKLIKLKFTTKKWRVELKMLE